MLKLISSENKSLKKYSYVVDCSYRYSICDLLVTSIIQEGRLQFVEFIKIIFIVILQAQMFWQLHYKRKTLEKGGVDLGVGPYQ